MTRSLQQIDRAIAGHARHRDVLKRQRRAAAYLADPTEDVAQVFADLDASIAREDDRIAVLLDERAEAMGLTTV